MSNGGCPIEGYWLYMEDQLNPGFNLVYDGSKSPEITAFTIQYPLIKPSQGYNFIINSKNCFWYSSNLQISMITASVPDAILSSPYLISYVSSNSILLGFNPPLNDGGFPITSFNLYVDNNLNVSLVKDEPHTYVLSGLTQGTNYKLQISSVN